MGVLLEEARLVMGVEAGVLAFFFDGVVVLLSSSRLRLAAPSVTDFAVFLSVT